MTSHPPVNPRGEADEPPGSAIPAFVPVLLCLFNALFLAGAWGGIAPEGVRWFDPVLFALLVSGLTLLELVALLCRGRVSRARAD